MSNNEKFKIKKKNLKNKISNYENNNENNNMNMTITGKGFYNSNGGIRAGNKLLVELMTGQNYIKDFLDEIKNNTEKILDMKQDVF